MNSIKVAIIGARGYVGFELIRLIQQHPLAELVAVYSRRYANQPVKDHLDDFNDPHLCYRDDYSKDLLSLAPDVVFVALPNGVAAAQQSLWNALSETTCVIDLSADFRTHTDWCYAQPETMAQHIVGQRRLANPGCYATAMQLGIRPVTGLIDGVVNAFGVSGYSGAGSSPSDKNDPDRLHNNLMAYQLVDHVHEKEVAKTTGETVRLLPHVAAFFRGIHVTLVVPLRDRPCLDNIHRCFVDHYRCHELIHVQQDMPEVQSVIDGHQVHIGGFAIKDHQLVVCVVLDNLLKGAATQAIQNMNLSLSASHDLSINTGLTSSLGVHK